MKIDNKSDEQVDIGDYTIYYTFDDNYDGDYGIQRYYYGIDNSGRNINDVNIEFLNRNDGIKGNELAKITFPSNMVNANGIVELKMGVHKQNWSNFDVNSHYSYGGTSNQYIFNDKIVVVKDGSVVFGIPKPDVDYGISKKLDTLYIPPTAFQKFIKPRLNYNDDTTDVRKAYYNDKIVVKSDYTASQLKAKIALFIGLHLDSITVEELHDDRKIVSFTVSQTIDSIINNMTDLTIEKDYVVVPQTDSTVTDNGTAIINDTYYEKQFLHSKYHTPKLWDNVAEKSTKIALFDTGVDPDHPDLEGSILSGGLSFVSDKISEGDENSIDENGHGTIMSCIITAKRNNSFGIAGINDSAKILPIKIIGSSGYGSASDIAKALYYIADETDIKLINMSIGTYTNVSYLQEAVDYAVSKGVVIIASSGNEGGKTYVYPAAYPNVISVGAVDRDGNITSQSNYGSWVDIYALGKSVMVSNASEGVYYHNGTSISSAVVTGFVSMLNNQSSVDVVKSKLQNSSNNIYYQNEFKYGSSDNLFELNSAKLFNLSLYDVALNVKEKKVFSSAGEQFNINFSLLPQDNGVYPNSVMARGYFITGNTYFIVMTHNNRVIGVDKVYKSY